MRFTNLEITNFLAITSASLRLDDRGLMLIQGVNEADTSAISNGAGKSSIADALCWAWFGTTARGVSGDDVVNQGAGKGCVVTSWLVDGDVSYRITRHRKHPTGKNMLSLAKIEGVTITDLTKGTDKLTQEVAQQVIGASLEVFSGSIYAGQERMPDLPAMTDKGLKMLIEEAAGVTELEAAYKRAREISNASETKTKAARQMLAQTDSQLADVEADILDLDAKITSHMESNKTQIELMKTYLRVDATRGITERKAVLDKVIADNGDMLKMQGRYDALEDRIKSVAGEKAEEDRLTRALTAANNSAVMLKTQERNAGDAVCRQEERIKRVDHQLGCPCDACGRPMTEAEIAPARELAQAELENLTKARVQATILAEEAENAVVKADNELTTYRKSMTDLGGARAAQMHLKDRMFQLENAQKDLDNFKESVRARIEELKVLEVNKTKTPYDDLLTKKTVRKLELTKLRAEQETAVEDAYLDERLNQEVVKVFAPGGVRARILDDVTPFLNTQTARYLSVLSDGNINATWSTLTPNAKGVLTENFSIDVTNATGGKVFGAISGGEKRKTRIAAALALQDLVATRASKPIELFIGDEIDDALDSAGLERLMVILEDKAKERGSVFIISHNEIRDMCRNVLTITKTASGETRVVETVS